MEFGHRTEVIPLSVACGVALQFGEAAGSSLPLFAAGMDSFLVEHYSDLGASVAFGLLVLAPQVVKPGQQSLVLQEQLPALGIRRQSTRRSEDTNSRYHEYCWVDSYLFFDLAKNHLLSLRLFVKTQNMISLSYWGF